MKRLTLSVFVFIAALLVPGIAFADAMPKTDNTGMMIFLFSLFAGIAILELIIWFFVLAVVFVTYGLGIWMGIDALQRTEDDFRSIGHDRLLWLIIGAVSFFYGMIWLWVIFYYFVIRKSLKVMENTTPTVEVIQEKLPID